MSSDLQSAVELIVLNNYATVLILTAIVYDYLLTFSREVEYVWCRSWTWISTMFVVVRYIGFCSAITATLEHSSFVPGPLEMYVFNIQLNHAFKQQNSCTMKHILSVWTFPVVVFATDLVMLLRVYAMWNRSKTILWILLFLYVVQAITFIIERGMYDNPSTHLSVSIIQGSNFAYCMYEYINIPAIFGGLRVFPRLTLAVALMGLAVAQTLKQSVGMYKRTKQWQLNRYMQLLIKDGILYFFVNVLYHRNFLLLSVGIVLHNTALLSLGTIAKVTFFPIIPRFIISTRALYDRDTQGRVHIDTGFGMHSRPNVGADTMVSAMVFVDGDQERQDPEREGTDGTDDLNASDIEAVHRASGPV